MTIQKIQVREERAEDVEALHQLAARSFGPGRFARTAHRVREMAPPVADLSLTAWTDDSLAGAIRFTAVSIGGKPGALLLGPLMVDERWTGKGCGRALICEGIERAREAGFALVLLVGDLPYYERFGFARVPPGQITMPGPVDPSRLLGVELVPGALEGFEGQIQGSRVG